MLLHLRGFEVSERNRADFKASAKRRLGRFHVLDYCAPPLTKNVYAHIVGEGRPEIQRLVHHIESRSSSTHLCPPSSKRFINTVEAVIHCSGCSIIHAKMLS